MESRDLTQKTPKRRPIELQLTAMIDIFSMIVIFMILGSVFGASDMLVPAGMSLPRTVSKEGAESAPRLVIGEKQVEVNLSGNSTRVLQTELFRNIGRNGGRNTGQKAGNDVEGSIRALKADLKAYVETLPKQAKTAGVLLNVLADRGTPYRDVFDVVRVFREAGFETLLFVGIGENQVPGAGSGAGS